MFFRGRSYKHKLVAMGDSMAQGFKNGGIYRTDLSFPAILARSLDPSTEFDLPSFSAQAGIPINIEVLIRGLAEKYEDGFTLGNSIGAGSEIYHTLRRIKSYWEGHLKSLKVEQDTPYHNQAIWGFTISDTMLMHEEYCRTYIKKNKPEIAILDIEMPKMSGVDVARECQSEKIPTTIIFLSYHQDPGFIALAKTLNIRGFLAKENSIKQIKTILYIL